jgi:hypothetical protein
LRIVLAAFAGRGGGSVTCWRWRLRLPARRLGIAPANRTQPRSIRTRWLRPPAAIVVALDNQDGTTHNFAVYTNRTRENPFRGQLFEGKKTVEERFRRCCSSLFPSTPTGHGWGIYH